MDAAVQRSLPVVVATSNAGKLREIEAILGSREISLVSLAGGSPVRFPEEGGDYAENAVGKARAAAVQRGCIAIADDSGLEVDALQGAPGPFSARFGGPGLDDRGRLMALLAALEGVPASGRGARFVCEAALATPTGEVVVHRGVCLGHILMAPEGRGGFGYDPIFCLEGRSETLADLDADEKNRHSHRARAFRALAPDLVERIRALPE